MSRCMSEEEYQRYFAEYAASDICGQSVDIFEWQSIDTSEGQSIDMDMDVGMSMCGEYPLENSENLEGFPF